MARLTCPECGSWLVEIAEATWLILDKGACAVESDLSTSEEVWADFDLVEKRADEWRERGVYDPLPPPPDPPRPSVTLICDCGRRTRFDRPAR
ncbi:MAG: hypothetical protein ACO3SP_09870 [Ilumatobacteraceae bacterium]